MKNTIIKISIAVACLLPLCPADVFCQEAAKAEAPAEPSGWRMMKSDNFTVYYRPDVDLENIEQNLRKRTYYLGGPVSGADAAIEEKIARRLDLLLKRAKEILGMYWKLPRINIRIFKDRNELGDEYVRIFGARQEYKSFYVHKYETIYSSEEDISDSVIAHEMGHAIIDHYFAVVPPPKVSELLATYVDMHLED